MTVIKTDRFDAQRNRLADLEAPTPATEQYEHWDASETGSRQANSCLQAWLSLLARLRWCCDDSHLSPQSDPGQR